MFTFVRRANLLQSNFRACAHLINTPASAFSSQKVPQALKRRKGKATEATVSYLISIFHSYWLINERCNFF